MPANQDHPRHNLRLTPALKKQLAHAAIDSGRSMNAEILRRLEQTFEPDAVTPLVEALKSVPSLSPEDRKRLGELLVEIGEILSRS